MATKNKDVMDIVMAIYWYYNTKGYFDNITYSEQCAYYIGWAFLGGMFDSITFSKSSEKEYNEVFDNFLTRWNIDKEWDGLEDWMNWCFTHVKPDGQAGYVFPDFRS